MARLFFSYSHDDEKLRDELGIHLTTLKREGVIEPWHDRGISAGSEFDREIRKELETADIILLLVSPYFIASDYIYDVELKRALERHEAHEAVVIPVILLPCEWESLSFGKLTATPFDGKPVSSFTSIHEGFLQVSKAIRKVAEKVNARSSSGAQPSEVSQVERTESSIADAQTSAIPHQLSPPLDDFTDRDDELTKLQAQVQNKGRIYAFFGVGGVGKTVLANKFVHDHLLERYPDAQFFVSLGGPSKNPKSVSEAQAHVISSVGRMVEPTDARLSVRYNDALHGKRAILFLDDASNIDQVLPLTPPQSCAMVVTSRQKLSLPGMYATDVPLLKLEDARDLLLKLAPRIGTHADKIAGLCGRLPIALRVVAAAIVKRENITVEEFVKRLTDRKERRAIVQAPLDVSYDLLSPELQRQFARLSVFPESFDASGAAAMWDLPISATEDALGDLLSFSLLEWYEPMRRYSLQPLVRDFADSRLNDSERAATEWKHAVHYLRILKEAGSQYLQGDEYSKQGLSLFDVERPNIHAAQSWFANNIDDKSVADTLTSEFSYSGSRLLALKQAPLERIKWYNAVLAAESNLTDRNERPMVQAGNFTFLAIAYRDSGDYDQTIKYCKEALSIDAAVSDKRLESIALGYLGIAHYYKGNYDEATTSVQSAIETLQKTNPIDKGTQAELLRYLGHAYRGLGNFEKAIEAYNQSLDSARQSAGLSAENNVLDALGMIYCDQGQQELARNDYLSPALKLAVEIGDRSAESFALSHLGLANRDLGLYAEAIDLYNKALTIANELGHQQLETYTNGGLGKTYLALNDFPTSLRHTQTAVQLAKKIGMKRARQFWETMLAQTHLYMGNMDQALPEIEKALLHKSPWVSHRTHAVHGLILAKGGRPELAGESFKRAAEEAEKVLTRTPAYVEVLYILGIALSGMALVNAGDRAVLVNESCATFERAYAACNAPGVINEVIRLFEELLRLDTPGDLNRPRDLLRQFAAATSSSPTGSQPKQS